MKRPKNSKKVLLTGGHAAATGYSVIQEIERRKKRWKLYWFGAKSAVEGKKVATLEEKIFSQMNVEFVPIVAGRVQTKFTFWTLPSLVKIPVGFVHSFLNILKIKPDMVVSFGGYVAVPVVFSAWLMRTPVIIHEQTAKVGRANLFSKHFAKKVLISRKSSRKYFPRNKTVLVGNPISQEIQSVKVKTKPSSPPVIFVAGGSRGSVSINEALEKFLPEILKEYKLIHQTGEYQYEYFLEVKKRLKLPLRQRYEVVSVVTPWRWYKLIEKADIIVGRSGANIVSEAIAAKRPSIFIPLPIAYNNEQMANARFAERKGIAVVIEQSKLSAVSLLKNLNKVNKNWKEMLKRAEAKTSPDIKASKLFVDEIEKILG